MDHQKSINNFQKNINVYSLPYIVWNNVRKFQENGMNSFRTTRLSVGMRMEMAGLWYLRKHFLSSANISLSIHKK